MNGMGPNYKFVRPLQWERSPGVKRTLENGGLFSDNVKREVWRKYPHGAFCAYCSSVAPARAVKLAPVDVEYDHSYPWKYGGSGDVTNCLLICKTCNKKKNAKILPYMKVAVCASALVPEAGGIWIYGEGTAAQHELAEAMLRLREVIKLPGRRDTGRWIWADESKWTDEERKAAEHYNAYRQGRSEAVSLLTGKWTGGEMPIIDRFATLRMDHPSADGNELLRQAREYVSSLPADRPARNGLEAWRKARSEALSLLPEEWTPDRNRIAKQFATLRTYHPHADAHELLRAARSQVL
jgi:hypothetical protein